MFICIFMASDGIDFAIYDFVGFPEHFHVSILPFLQFFDYLTWHFLCFQLNSRVSKFTIVFPTCKFQVNRYHFAWLAFFRPTSRKNSILKVSRTSKNLKKKFFFDKNSVEKNPSFENMDESDKKFSVYQARVVLQYLNDQVYEQTEKVKLIEDNLSQCQR